LDSCIEIYWKNRLRLPAFAGATRPPHSIDIHVSSVVNQNWLKVVIQAGLSISCLIFPLLSQKGQSLFASIVSVSLWLNWISIDCG